MRCDAKPGIFVHLPLCPFGKDVSDMFRQKDVIAFASSWAKEGGRERKLGQEWSAMVPFMLILFLNRCEQS